MIGRLALIIASVFANNDYASSTHDKSDGYIMFNN